MYKDSFGNVSFLFNRIQIRHFKNILKQLVLLINFLLFFLTKGVEKPKKQVRITKQISSPLKVEAFSNLVVTLLLMMNPMDFEKQDELKEPLGVINIIPRFLTIPHLLFKLIDNDTILGLGLGCESERINQGRSYMNINISDCFF